MTIAGSAQFLRGLGRKCSDWPNKFAFRFYIDLAASMNCKRRWQVNEPTSRAGQVRLFRHLRDFRNSGKACLRHELEFRCLSWRAGSGRTDSLKPGIGRGPNASTRSAGIVIWTMRVPWSAPKTGRITFVIDGEAGGARHRRSQRQTTIDIRQR